MLSIGKLRTSARQELTEQLAASRIARQRLIAIRRKQYFDRMPVRRLKAKSCMSSIRKGNGKPNAFPSPFRKLHVKVVKLLLGTIHKLFHWISSLGYSPSRVSAIVPLTRMRGVPIPPQSGQCFSGFFFRKNAPPIWKLEPDILPHRSNCA